MGDVKGGRAWEFDSLNNFHSNSRHIHHQQTGEPVAPFNVGDQVEVSFERDEAYGVWFPATVNKCLLDNSYLVQYWHRKEGTAEALLKKSIVSSPRIRPPSPLYRKKSFGLFDTVDAFYDFAWTTGVIIKDFYDKKFMVSCKRTDNKMVFSETKLRPHMEWVDGRWVDASQNRVSDNDASHTRPLKKSKSENAAEVTTFTACKTDAAKATIVSNQDSSQERKTPTSSVCQTDVAASKRYSEVLSLRTESHSLGDKLEPKTPTATVCQTDAAASKIPSKVSSLETDNCSVGGKVGQKQSLVADSDASHSRPPKESKSENAAEVTNLTAGKTDPVSQTDSAASKRHSTVSSLETDNCSAGDKNTIGISVSELESGTAKSSKKRGRPPKICQSSTEGNESYVGETTVEGANEEVRQMEHVAAMFLDLAHNGTKSTADTIPCQLHTEEFQTSDQNGHGNDPTGLAIEENLKNKERDQMERSPELLGPGSKVETSTKSNETVKQAVSSDRQEVSSSNKGGKTNMNLYTKSHHSTVDEVPLEETEVHALAIDSSPCMDVDVNQALPFGKTVPLWDTLESMKIFQLIPQKPHFRPLESSNEDLREGLAVGHMVTFLKIASKIPELRVDMARSSVEMSLENLVVLEENGFDVKFVRDRLNDMLLKKDKLDLLQNDLKEYENQIVECKSKTAYIDRVVDEIDKQLEELRAKREAAVSEREIQDAALAASQSSLDNIKESMKTIESDFKELAVLPRRE